MGDNLLEVSDLCVERGDRLLFENLNLETAGGRILEVSGPNGSGKTSLLRAIAGLIHPAKGLFSWRGSDVSSAHAFSDELLYVGHKPAVRMQMTPYENLRAFELTQGTSVDDDQLLQALSDVGLRGYEEEVCSRLSAGQKRRVGLARIRFTQSSLWLLDEPFTAIDTKGVKTLCGWIDEFVTQGGSVIFTTHQSVSFPNVVPQALNLEAVG